METIRKALPADLNSIVEFYGAKGDTPWDPFADVDRLRHMVSLDDLVVAKVDGSFAGFVYFFVSNHPWFDPEVDRYGHILETHVKPRYQRMGIATRMLEYVMKDLKKRCVKVAYIDTAASNAKALRLYEKMGFREIGRHIHFKKIID